MRLCDPGRFQAAGDLHIGVDVARHLHGIARRGWCVLRPPLDCLEQVPLIDDRMSPPQRAGSRHRTRVHPRSPGDFVSDAHWRPRQPRQPGTSRPAMQIDDDFVSFAPKPSCETKIISDSPQAGPAARRDDDFVQVRILSNDRKRLRFYQVRKMRVRKRALQRPDERRRKNNVSNQAKADQKNSHCRDPGSGTRDPNCRNPVIRSNGSRSDRIPHPAYRTPA